MKRLGLMVVALLACGFGSARADATVDSLRWMAGSWASDSGGVRVEEHWTAPYGGLMTGMHRDFFRGRLLAFEFARIRRDSVGLVYLAQPGGRPPHPFRLKSIATKSVVFEDPEHDFPQRVMYWLDAGGNLHARVEGMMRGQLEGENWRWKPSSLLEPKP